MDAISKHLVEFIPVGWVLILRSVLVCVMVIGSLLVLRRFDWFGSTARGVLAARSIIFGVTSVMVVVALGHLTLAETIALYFLSPIAIVFLAAWILGEPITRRALIATMLGFIGVVLIVQPQSGGATWYYALPLAAAVTGALQEVLVRRMRVGTHPSTIVLYGSLATILVSVLALPFDAPPAFSNRELGLLVASAIAGVVAFFFVAVSFQKAPMRIIAPLRYLNIVWAVILGYLFWNSVPNPSAAIGIALIMVAGIMCVWTPSSTY